LPAPSAGKTSFNLPAIGSNVNRVLASNASSVVHNSGGNTSTMENHISVNLPSGASDAHAGMAVASEIRRQIVISNANSGYA
jgi:type IV pilus biogenesis protein CpaD/CtpE